ncbi:polysaccharide pyruvyl transferase family protein [Rhodococcus sp. PAMC28707]|uniref:polysaccharide pyruvyl transferase family protein n=1 Tax=unclassified Rhodococcus (in: high G+C Gram-positive bacteria) TaxID=192944 RepID=UPI00109DCFE4|nr:MULTISPECIES: polysaccharide pyruvyl transferase family protein [unclassified Rhodococcus (in: high G+C Gram-positive bacteria)]QCB49910.1 polysaccharide pyruvyl transferase family protein [Rhodococcus sp. PAMC28705]QCB58397.1 polysaccharide pyruvyl transferase family protein [Rhodococcus sp. PAMC28707]
MKQILLTGVNFQNQGAYMMLVAAADEIRRRNIGQPVIDIRWGSRVQKRSEGLGTLISIDELLAFRSLMADRLPFGLRSKLPFHTYKDIDGVVDASGFAFGDQWSHARLDARANRFRFFADRGVPVVILPQAFGPLHRTKSAAETVLGSSKLIYARDPESFAYLQELDSFSTANVKVSSDFTVTLKGRRPKAVPQDWGSSIVIVPNTNIVSRGDGGRYLDVLAKIIQDANSINRPVIGLVHDTGKDREIFSALAERGLSLSVIDGFDGLESKWILGSAKLVVSGRFHATVSALSQGVPTVIHGWSHKYEHLAKDFGVPELLASPYDLQETVTAVAIAESASDINERLLARKQVLAAGVVRMWDEVDETLRM